MARHCARARWPQYDWNSCLGLPPGLFLALLVTGCGVSTGEELADDPGLVSQSSLLRARDPRPRSSGTNGGDNHGGDNHGGDNHGGDNHGGDNHGGDNHGGDNHGGDNHGGDNHGGDAGSCEGTNGLGTNGLGTNGLGTNGLGTNGLGTNGLSISAMNTPEFATWFNQDPVLADMVMKYIVTCAVAEGSSRTWTNPSTSVEYTWLGNFGLTPAWASGSPSTEIEQQLITACLAAHANKYGLQVPISVQGLDATGTPIPVGLLEFASFSTKEACFFGNLFQGEGIFAGNDGILADGSSSVRACGLEADSDTTDECSPIHHVARCQDLCVPDPLNNYYLSCTYNGKTYRAITTRIRPVDIFVCGDDVCQISESCGTGFTPGNCRDCGPCQ